MTLQFSKGIIQKISKWRWFSFLKMQKKVCPKIKSYFNTIAFNSKKDIANDFGVPEAKIFQSSLTELIIQEFYSLKGY